MNISTYESQIKALEAGGGGGGGGSSDGVFLITINPQITSCDKTFAEVKNAVLNNTIVFVKLDSIVLPNFVEYIDDNEPIFFSLTRFGITPATTPIGTADLMTILLNPDESVTVDSNNHYTFAITEVTP